MKKHFDTVMTFSWKSAESFSRILKWEYTTNASKERLSQMLRDGDAIRARMSTKS